MNFVSIRVLKDNIMYLFYNDEIAFCVDPVEPLIIDKALNCEFDKQDYKKNEIQYLKNIKKKRKLLYSFTTHSHWDHSSGDVEIRRLHPNLKQVLGFLSFPCKDMEMITINSFIKVLCIHTPCHTKDSFCFYVNDKYLCTGDTIFYLGCGKFFEGNSDDFTKAVDKIVSNVEKKAIMLYGHDYRDSDIMFARRYTIIPEEMKTKLFLTLEEEIKYNPFFYQDKNIKNRNMVVKQMRDEKNNM